MFSRARGNDMIFEIKTLKNDCLYIHTGRGFYNKK